ncbi:diguanylate cyclase [Roseateles sp.]|uniref:GGDEF domain-containing protein n=1 Tax=Roseateles sp. TaxID=1971397 RepID=UPI00394BF595
MNRHCSFGRVRRWAPLVLSALLGLLPLAPASAEPPSKAWQQLEAVERRQRADPAPLAEQLRALEPRLAVDSAERLEAQTLLGLLAAQDGDLAQVTTIVKWLQDWPLDELQPSAQVAAACVWAEYQRRRGDLREARKALAKVSVVQREGALPLQRWRYHRQASYTALDAGALELAQSEAQLALKLAEQLAHPWRVALSLADMAALARRLRQDERSRLWISRALTAAESDPDPITLYEVHTGRALIHSEDSAIALQSYSQALQLATEAGAARLRALALANLSDYHLRHGKPSVALDLAQQSLALVGASDDPGTANLARFNIGLAKVLMGRLAEGRALAKAAVQAELQHGALATAAEDWLELARYLERMQDLPGAAEAYREGLKLAQPLRREQLQRRLLEAQERFDADRRDRDLELLARDKALKAAQISQRNLQLGLWALIGGCVLVSAALVVQALRRARHANARLAVRNAALKHQSESDSLTGLSNRRHFKAVMRQQGTELQGSLFLIDIDHFKRINDSYGHAGGDQVLIELARRLRHQMRDDDLVVRWGGEEFLVYARTTEPLLARALAQRLLDVVGRTPVDYESLHITASASIGFVSLPLAPHGLRLPWERAIDLVDTVMYLAKVHGRNRAYGLERMLATDPLQAAELAARLEGAWQAGDVTLVSLEGPKLGSQAGTPAPQPQHPPKEDGHALAQ